MNSQQTPHVLPLHKQGTGHLLGVTWTQSATLYRDLAVVGLHFAAASTLLCDFLYCCLHNMDFSLGFRSICVRFIEHITIVTFQLCSFANYSGV